MPEIIHKDVGAGMPRLGFRDTEIGRRKKLLALVSHLHDGDVRRLPGGGHAPHTVYAACHAAVSTTRGSSR